MFAVGRMFVVNQAWMVVERFRRVVVVVIVVF